MFHEYLDENTIKLAPTPLRLDGKDVFTNSEEIHNQQGYYKLKILEYPQDENTYKPVFSFKNNNIIQSWVVEENQIYNGE